MPASSERKSVSAIAIGCSAGGVDALRLLLNRLPKEYPYPVFITIHRDENKSSQLIDLLNSYSSIPVVSPDDKEAIVANRIYVAPGDYHLQIERNFTFSLSIDSRVHYCRPAVDVMFETAAWAYGPRLVGVVLTGANEDGSLGLRTIKDYGGLAIVESPETARFPMMPIAAIAATSVDYVLSLEEIVAHLVSLKKD